MPSQTERSSTTRAAIIDAAEELYGSQGLSTPLDAVAAEAGVTKGSVHYHFGSRHGLFEALVIRSFNSVEEAIAADWKDGGAREWVRAVLDEASSTRGRVRISMADELVLAGLVACDPYPYLCRKLNDFDISGAPTVVAAAIVEFGRRVAMGTTTPEQLDEFLAELLPLLEQSS